MKNTFLATNYTIYTLFVGLYGRTNRVLVGTG